MSIQRRRRHVHYINRMYLLGRRLNRHRDAWYIGGSSKEFDRLDYRLWRLRIRTRPTCT